MTAPRSFGLFATVFAAAYAVLYVLAEQFNLALFTYHPAIMDIDAGRVRAKAGPAMYWYGWMTTAGLGALAAGLIATALPERLTRRVSADVAWVVPALAMVACGYFMAPFFLR